ncbi:hypothetical protein IEQ34_005278 [Dendrobium chrysotoxum]|uniref:Uncharacterized protein n=1 Tax=Dendrobium chrysotoxum TaxID=161865 RepID=A0AAV7HAM5_DENCH|nr:hypothetical protein IEQ34_005278 [Dendrobium chrysotoxum]
MASFLHRSRTTSHLFQNLRSLNPLSAHLNPKPLHAPPPPLKHSKPISAIHLFSSRSSKTMNNPFLHDYSISTFNIRSQSLLSGNPTIPNSKRSSSTLPENPQPELRHQEITGPTVEPDISPLANETREVLESLRRSVYHLSSALAVLGVAHLGLGAWIAYAVRPPNEVSVQGLAAFAFPFSVAFLLRRTVKPMTFFQNMEQQGRLQVLTLALQVSKSLRVLFVRMRVVCVCCVVGVSAGSVVTLWMRYYLRNQSVRISFLQLKLEICQVKVEMEA